MLDLTREVMFDTTGFYRGSLPVFDDQTPRFKVFKLDGLGWFLGTCLLTTAIHLLFSSLGSLATTRLPYSIHENMLKEVKKDREAKRDGGNERGEKGKQRDI